MLTTVSVLIYRALVYFGLGVMFVMGVNVITGLIMFAYYHDCDPVKLKVLHSQQYLIYSNTFLTSIVPPLLSLFAARWKIWQNDAVLCARNRWWIQRYVGRVHILCIQRIIEHRVSIYEFVGWHRLQRLHSAKEFLQA